MNILEEAYKIANKDRSTELMSSMHKPSYYDGLLQGALEMADVMKEQFVEWLNNHFDINVYEEIGGKKAAEILTYDFKSMNDMITEVKKL